MSNGKEKMYDIAEKGLGGIRTAFRGSRLGGGEGWFGTQKKLEGVNVSGRGKRGQTQVDPMFSDSKEFRGIIGSLQKRKLLKGLEDLGAREDPHAPWAGDIGQVTPLRYIGDEGGALDYGGALSRLRRYRGLGPGPDFPHLTGAGADLPSYRDWEQTPWYAQGDDYSQLFDESADANELYKQYARSPKNLLQLLTQKLSKSGGHKNDNFVENYDYRGLRE